MSTCEPRDWDIPVSYTAQNTFNPMRNVVETIHIEENPQLELIRLTVDYNACIRRPCKNNGLCIRLDFSYRCNYKHGYSGKIVKAPFMAKIFIICPLNQRKF
ncbi:neurogenic locus notch homolog protein 1-like [Xenia sp. Carnegie-2017]|uniref:neurogenic locus notch homolog protein 1-like n=1 Tax=Xenia sp. Carnegie-2017 TaxID=2897299 RepID=UPI001F04E02B|nr:neurogenic locus notch homolog protein 1-like [Xenia sp. Carnegie-2017]